MVALRGFLRYMRSCERRITDAPGRGHTNVAFPLAATVPTWGSMFVVDEPTADAIRRAYEDGGELSAIVEFKRHFPLIDDHAKARECVRIIAGWQPVPEQPPTVQKRR